MEFLANIFTTKRSFWEEKERRLDAGLAFAATSASNHIQINIFKTAQQVSPGLNGSRMARSSQKAPLLPFLWSHSCPVLLDLGVGRPGRNDAPGRDMGTRDQKSASTVAFGMMCQPETGDALPRACPGTRRTGRYCLPSSNAASGFASVLSPSSSSR